MNRRPRSQRFGLPIIAVAIAMLLRWLLWDVLENELAFLFLWPAVIFSAWYGGLWPGLLATTFATLSATFFFFEPRFSFAVSRPTDMVGSVVFLCVNAAISFICEKLHCVSRQTELRAREVDRQREWLRVSLTSIGDAVIATDTEGRVSFLNPVAQAATGWTPEEALGQPLERVFRIVNERTREPAQNPVATVLRDGKVVGLANHTVLISRDGMERPIEDSAAPIKAEGGSIIGVILVFRDVTGAKQAKALLDASETNYQTSRRFAVDRPSED